MGVTSRRPGREGTIRRRELLAAAGAMGMASLGGCIQDIRGRLGDEVAGRVVSGTAASPSFFYAGGENRTGERQQVETDYTMEYVPIVARGEFEGVSRTVDLDGIYTDSKAAAQDYNSSRSNKPRTEIAFDDETDEDDIGRLLEYLAAEPTVSQRFVVVVPDASVAGREESLANVLTPKILLDQLSAEPTRLANDEGMFVWGRAKQGADDRLECYRVDSGDAAGTDGDKMACRAAHLSVDTDGSNRGVAVERMGGAVVVSTVPRDEGAPSWRFVSDSGDDDSDDDGLSTVPSNWGGETSVDGAAVSPCLVGAVTVQPPGCPCPMPALFNAWRLRHGGQLLYVGGWLVDDGALYENSATMLVAEGPNDIVGIEHGDDAAAMRKAAESGFTRKRGRFGSVCYDGALDRESLAYLPPDFHDGEGPQRLASISKRSARTGRTREEPEGSDDGQQGPTEARVPLVDGAGEGMAMQCLIGALDCPLVQVDAAEPCHNGCCCPSKDCACNWIPAMNGQLPR
ncbi:hypothetical protein [Haloarchaeobius sp. HME9146]|uniref:hypothetical protein n=1 Tax=Haloarchaeobius sp. HME9146 TaxID=2978732 RepID=UPI0021C24B84|nr:hypothetical protein [Haloarchaeobius sp. HME9146]MCT9097628.1 hypothetical protein [Haloarchaeobius sp. HME9146]